MIKQTFDIDGYWKVVVYYDLDPAFFDDVELELKLIDFPETAIEEVRKTMLSEEAKAVTCSNQHTSVVIFNSHTSKADYLNSIVHEAEHIKQAMLYVYHVKDVGEPPAYTVGYLVSRMWEVFRRLVCTA